MTQTTQTIALPAKEATLHARPSLLKSYSDLGKVRLSGMVVVTTALGFIVASKAAAIPAPINWTRLAWTCLGTFLAAVGASAFNQIIEAPRDARMNRTKRRPIPTGALSRMHAAYVALLACLAGVAILCPTSNGLTAILAAVNILLYVAVYTPMKPRTASNTLVGAVVGAIPPMMGWTAASGMLSAGAWVLGAILFVWQIPHFLALAWLYREDYARGGYKMLSTIEPSGRFTSFTALLYSIILIPLCLAVAYLGYAGWEFAMASTVLCTGLVALALRFAITRTNTDARRLFLATLLLLPLLSLILILNARGPDTFEQTDAGYVHHPYQPVIDPGLTP